MYLREYATVLKADVALRGESEHSCVSVRKCVVTEASS